MTSQTAGWPTVHLRDIPLGAIERIERAVGARMSEWPAGVASEGELYAQIYAAGQKEHDLAAVKSKLTIAGMRELVVLDDESDGADVDPI